MEKSTSINMWLPYAQRVGNAHRDITFQQRDGVMGCHSLLQRGMSVADEVQVTVSLFFELYNFNFTILTLFRQILIQTTFRVTIK